MLLAAHVGFVGSHDGDDAANRCGAALCFVQVNGIVAIRKRQIGNLVPLGWISAHNPFLVRPQVIYHGLQVMIRCT